MNGDRKITLHANENNEIHAYVHMCIQLYKNVLLTLMLFKMYV